MKIRPVGAEMFQEDSETDRRTKRNREKLIVVFHNFEKVFKTGYVSSLKD